MNRSSLGKDSPLSAPSDAALFQYLFIGILVLAPLYPLSRSNYLLFHTLVELASVIVAGTVFSIGWNTRRIAAGSSLLVLGIGYLAVGGIDLFHALAYKGTGILPDIDANPATQLWIVARYMESLTLVAAAFLVGKSIDLRPRFLLTAWVGAGTVLIISIIPLGWFPDCYVEGTGLTRFKVISEYLVSGLLLLAMTLFLRRRGELNQRVLVMLLASVSMTILSELSFTLYVDVYGFFNYLGHVFKLLSVVLVYMALVQGALSDPYRNLFNDLAESEARLREDLARRRRLEQQRETYIHTISHDLRNPLTYIRGHAEMLQLNLREAGLAGQPLESVKVILQGVGTISGMTEDMVDTARMDGGQLKLDRQPLHLGSFVEVLLQRSKWSLGTERVEARIPEELPPVSADPARLERIFLNLLSNALKYSSPDTPVGIRAEKADNRVAVTVADQGQGIPKEDLPNIFDAFYQARGNRKTDSVGLGLHIVKMLVEAHGGTITVESKEGEGTFFTFYLPTSGTGNAAWA